MEVIMKRYFLLSLMLLLGFAAGMASASPTRDNTSEHRVVQVLVQVNANGEVTGVAPAYQLRPAFVRQIRDALQKMITEPAMKHGKPASSQLVVTLGLVPTVRENGERSVEIKYISSKALPDGSWYWMSSSSRQLTLAGQAPNFSRPTMHVMVEQREQ
jgi:hypothetical protein